MAWRNFCNIHPIYKRKDRTSPEWAPFTQLGTAQNGTLRPLET